MAQRIIVLALGCAVVVITAVWLQINRPLVEQIADGMAGKKWYRIQLSGEHVGYMYNNAYRDHRGRWHFKTTTHFHLQSSTPTTISKHLLFAAKPPYELVEARYQNRQNNQELQTNIIHEKGRYAATTSGARMGKPVQLDWQYSLSTFVDFEQWLQTQQPQSDATHLAKSIDFERLNITQRNYRVVEQNEQGYLVETNAPLQATQTQLDQQFRPIRLNMAGIFDVVAATEAQAISLTQMRAKTNYLFSLDQRLDNHTELKQLQLSVQSNIDFDLPEILNLDANPVTSSGEGKEYTGTGLRYPITDSNIQALVAQSLQQGNSPAEHVELLVKTTQDQIRYVEDKPAGSVMKALKSGQGECTDFADLFTTLARAAGYPARNVYGLAYKDGPHPAFMFHAWNEIRINNKWQAVDPTWNQTRVDATHIPLTDAQAALMMLANNTSQISFQVLSKAYF